jgi:uncharacterized protein (TIGR03067 family)
MFLRDVRTFRDGRWEVERDGRLQTGTYTADPSRNPRRLDLIRIGDSPEPTRKCIYRLEGNLLKVGYRSETGERPEDFDDDELFVDVYKRVRK